MIFSKKYLAELRDRTGFRSVGLERQMTLLYFLREIGRHPFLKSRLVLKGGTAINMFWFELPRLSVDIDLNYIGSADRETMLKERPVLDAELKNLFRPPVALFNMRQRIMLEANGGSSFPARWRRHCGLRST